MDADFPAQLDRKEAAAPRIAMARLTRRQREVACLLADGLSDAEVAARLAVSEHTIHEHVRHIYERLGCHRRGQLVALLLRGGLCTPSE